jgi:tetratricopeptide (TPR) repeat protein
MNWKKWALIALVGVLGFGTVRSYVTDKPLTPPIGDRFAQAEYFYFASHYEEAVKAYREALEEGLSEPRAKSAYFKIGSCLHKSGHYHEAIQAYQDAIRRYPQSEEANYAGGEIERIKLHHLID